jgi:hypothetical protein
VEDMINRLETPEGELLLGTWRYDPDTPIAAAPRFALTHNIDLTPITRFWSMKRV